MKTRQNIRKLCLCAVMAAMYTAITILAAPLSYGLMQFRLSEALVVLCAFEPSLGVGFTIGCFLANVFSTVTALDMIIGTLATALACIWTARCKKAVFAAIPNIVANAILVGGMLAFTLFPENPGMGFFVSALQVGFGELVIMMGLGVPLFLFEKKRGLVQKLMG